VRQPSDANNVKSNFLAKSLLVPENKPLSTSALTDYFTHVVTNGNKLPAQWVSTFRLMGGAGSKVSAKGDSWSAVSNRNSLWIVQYDSQTDRNPRDVTRFIESSTSALQGAANGDAWNSFAPFVDPTLSDSKSHRVYFSARTYKKRKTYKDLYDNHDIFHNAQSIDF
jgi:hypothetical protein